MRPDFLIICIALVVASARPLAAAELSAVFTGDNFSLNSVLVGEVKEGRSTLSLAALVQALGAPNRTQVQGGATQRITWDEAGIQLETSFNESTPFALLIEFGKPSTADQGVVPSGQFSGILDCLGIKLRGQDRIGSVRSLLTLAKFNREPRPGGAESWSLQLEHWSIYLLFTADGTIDSAVIRVLPDLF
jgi:hypothetical protein